ncbi:hypothetical protein [Methylococcus capsulatus]|uniref:hypothetical protein n=1 Tax=Methylococcus capsulatus TaxID=414 RepID=UPI001C52EA12|nr:hypothetical protein [Methylococcus capsulatus]QXP90015.1 hypothetical protein KW114_13270 [Methylococcus capsulatus]
MPSPTDHVIALLESDHPDPASMAWLRDGLRRYINGYGTLQDALGIVEACPRGLRDAVRHARIRRAIVQAADLLPEGSTPYSKAKLIRAELLRLLRTWPRCTTRSRMDELLLEAIQAADGDPPSGLTTIRDIIANDR